MDPRPAGYRKKTQTICNNRYTQAQDELAVCDLLATQPNLVFDKSQENSHSWLRSSRVFSFSFFSSRSMGSQSNMPAYAVSLSCDNHP